MIVGCGLIAGGYGDVNTHAGALTRRGTRIVACVEPDDERRTQFMRRWNVAKGYAGVDAALADGCDADIVCVCTPTERHSDDLQALLNNPSKAVFAEKPLAIGIDSARAIVSAYRAEGRLLAVNYTRRWNPGLRRLAAEIHAGRFGVLEGASGWYGKGVVHNGSHMIDLLHLLIGQLDPKSATLLVDDGREDDPTVDAVLRAKNGAYVRLTGTDYRSYDIFELQLAFSGALVVLEQGATRLRIRPLEDTPGFAGHRRPAHGDFEDIGASDVLLRAFDNIAASVEGREVLASDGASALAAQETAAAMMRMARPRLI